MRLSLRFLLPLAIVLALLAYAVIPLVDTFAIKWFVRDLDMRSKLIANTMEGPVSDMLASQARGKLLAYFHRVIQDERLYAIGFCDQAERLLYKTQTYPDAIPCTGPNSVAPDRTAVLPLTTGPVHVASRTVRTEGKPLGHLILVHDMSWVERRSADTKRYIFYLFVVMGAVIALVTVLVAHLSWRGWVSGVQDLLKGGNPLAPSDQDHAPELRPVAKDLRALIQDLEADRRLRDESRISWTPAALRRILHDQLAGDEVLIVSNREPYIHNWRGDHIEVQVPASGLVTALEPVMRACSGTWIAHGSGSADREAVDVRPPQQHRVGAQRERLHDIGPATDPAVHEQRRPFPQRVPDLHQGLEGRHATVQLSGTVVADHDRVESVLQAAPGIVRSQDALDQEREPGPLAEPPHVAPAQPGIGEDARQGLAGAPRVFLRGPREPAPEHGIAGVLSDAVPEDERRETGPGIPVAEAQDGGVNGQDDGSVAAP